jgi:hypothetical protein
VIDLIKRYWGIIALIVVILLLLDKCSSNPIKEIKSLSKPEVIYRDSVVYEDRYIDTLYKWKDRVRVKTQYVLVEGAPSGADFSDTSVFNSNHYVYQHNDNSIKSSISVFASERPDSVILDYSVLETTIKDSSNTTTKITEKVRVNQLYFGGNATVYPGFNSLSVGLDFVSKKGWQVEGGIGYDLSNNNPMFTVGYKKLISFRKKN